MSFYGRMAATTKRLVGQFGRTATLRRTIPGVYDPVAGVEGADVIEEQWVTCIILPASKGTVEAFDQRLMSGTLIETNLRAVKIPAEGLEWPPGPGYEMDFDGHTWRVIGVTTSNPAGTALIYNLSVQR
jgi:hypothetical protein